MVLQPQPSCFYQIGAQVIRNIVDGALLAFTTFPTSTRSAKTTHDIRQHGGYVVR